MKLSNNLIRLYSFILNKENRALDYYKKIVDSCYAPISEISPLFDIHLLERDNFSYTSEALLFYDILSKYDTSKILKGFYQGSVFDQLISDDLMWLRIKCDNFHCNLSKNILTELDYRIWFNYIAQPFKDIFNINNIVPQIYLNNRTNLMFYMFSPLAISSSISSFTLSSIFFLILFFDFSNKIHSLLDMSSYIDLLKAEFNDYIDSNADEIVQALNKFISKNIYNSYTTTIDTVEQFTSIKALFANFVDHNRLSLFTNIRERLIPNCLTMSCILDIFDYMCSTELIYNVLPVNIFYIAEDIETKVFNRYINNYSPIKMADYIMIPYKYKDVSKFIHLLPVVVEAYVDDHLYPRTDAVDTCKDIIVTIGVDMLSLDYTYLSTNINNYILSSPHFFVDKSNYQYVIDLASKLCLHEIIFRFLSSDQFTNWQLEYLTAVDNVIEYNPHNVNYIYLQNFVKLYLSNRFLYDVYVSNEFGNNFKNNLVDDVNSILSDFEYQYTETILNNNYNIFRDIFLHDSFRNFIDSFIFSSLIRNIVLDRLNYYHVR